jgi:minichromosome maintenance protein 10
MSSTSAPKRKPAYDPARQWGLKPETREPGSHETYVIPGLATIGSGSDLNGLFVAETMGREGQAKAHRKLARKDADRALKTLLERDKEGMKVVLTAREFVMQEAHEQRKGAQAGKGNGKGKGIEKGGKERERGRDATAKPNAEETASSKHSYSAEVIKQLGFDPVVKAGHRRPGDLSTQKKVCSCHTCSFLLADVPPD